MKALRRKDRETPQAETEELLTNGEYGILSTIGKNGQPYGVPLNYTYTNNCIYFHCATSGHKLENIQNNPRVSFCVVGHTNVLAAEFTTRYESVMIFGVASEVQGAEKYNALVWLLEKYSAKFIEEGKNVISKMEKVTKVLKIQIDHISGKGQK